jgi:hypothetical protein
MMGLNLLAIALQQFDSAADRSASATALQEAAAAALHALRRQQLSAPEG